MNVVKKKNDKDSTYVLLCEDLGRGTYYLRLMSSRSDAHGYTLLYTPTPTATPADAEPNDDSAQAITLQNGLQVAGLLGYAYQDNDDACDWYKIELPHEGEMVLNFTLPLPHEPYRLELYDRVEGNNIRPLLDRNIPYSDLEMPKDTTYQFVQNGMGKGVYYLKLTRQRKVPGAYRVSYQFTANPFTLDNVAHSSYEQRIKLKYNETYSSAMGYKYQGQLSTTEEWYELDISNIEMLSLQIEHNALLNLTCTLYCVEGTNSDGTPMLTQVVSDNLRQNQKELLYNIPLKYRNKPFVVKMEYAAGLGEYFLTFGYGSSPWESPLHIIYNDRNWLRKGVLGKYAVTIGNHSDRPTHPFILQVGHTPDITLIGCNLPNKRGEMEWSAKDIAFAGEGNASFVVPQLRPWEYYTFEIIAEGKGDFEAPKRLRVLNNTTQPQPAPTTTLFVGTIIFTDNKGLEKGEEGLTDYITQQATQLYSFSPQVQKAYALGLTQHINELKQQRQHSGIVMVPTKSVVQNAAELLRKAIPTAPDLRGEEHLEEIAGGLANQLGRQLWVWLYEDGAQVDESNVRIVDAKTMCTNILTSWDPNEMVGPRGYGQENFLATTRTMNYRILFENKAEASAPAYRVRIFDELDPNVFDVESVQFGATSHDAPQYQWKMTREDNRLTWDIEGIELPPNVHAPEGEGYVTFSVRLKPNLPDGQVIANKATIVFDKNKPIETNTYANTLDLTAPQTQEIRPSYTKGDAKIQLTFTANETGSGVAGYLLYVAKNGGELEYFAQCHGNQVEFSVDKDAQEHYGFYALGIDNVGNTEEANDSFTSVETTTHIAPFECKGTDEVEGVYTLDGRRTTILQKGVSILKMKNGTSIKVLVR